MLYVQYAQNNNIITHNQIPVKNAQAEELTA